MPPCFDECDCSCGYGARTFDKTLAHETNFGLTLYDVTHAGIHWYTDKSMDDSGLDSVTFAKREGECPQALPPPSCLREPAARSR